MATLSASQVKAAQAMVMMTMMERWLSTWSGLDVPATPRLHQLYAQLMSRYAEPHRHYHSARHLAECFERWQELRECAVHPAEVEAALWFHDAIYDTHNTDNEAQSAVLALDNALALGVDAPSARRIHDLILFTRHAAEPIGRDAEALVDTDLSILSAEPDRFDEYERQVRQEYDWVPEHTFRQRRAALLRQFLTRPRIYSTGHFRQQYESRARVNLNRSLARLRP